MSNYITRSIQVTKAEMVEVLITDGMPSLSTPFIKEFPGLVDLKFIQKSLSKSNPGQTYHIGEITSESRRYRMPLIDFINQSEEVFEEDEAQTELPL